MTLESDLCSDEKKKTNEQIQGDMDELNVVALQLPPALCVVHTCHRVRFPQSILSEIILSFLDAT